MSARLERDVKHKMFDTEREIKDTRIRLCLDCGKCTSVCPVAQYDLPDQCY